MDSKSKQLWKNQWTMSCDLWIIPKEEKKLWKPQHLGETLWMANLVAAALSTLLPQLLWGKCFFAKMKVKLSKWSILSLKVKFAKEVFDAKYQEVHSCLVAHSLLNIILNNKNNSQRLRRRIYLSKVNLIILVGNMNLWILNLIAIDQFINFCCSELQTPSRSKWICCILRFSIVFDQIWLDFKWLLLLRISAYVLKFCLAKFWWKFH